MDRDPGSGHDHDAARFEGRRWREDWSTWARGVALFERVAASEVVETVIVRDQAALDALLDVLHAAPGFAVDTETTSIDAMQAELVGISLSVDGKTAYYIPVGHRTGEQLPLQVVVDALRPPLTDPSKPKYLHNVTYDLVVL